VNKGDQIDLSAPGEDGLSEQRFTLLRALQDHPFSDSKDYRTYKKKEQLFEEEKRPRGVYCINRGKVKVFKRGIDGKEQIVHLAREGDLLGYRAMFSEENYPVGAAALEECSVCFIPRDSFYKILKSAPDLYERLLRQACRELAVMTGKVTNLAQKTVRERAAIGLLHLRDIYSDEHGDPVTLNLTREDLANIVGTATETLIRLLHVLKDENVIESKGRKITIIDVEALQDIANYQG
jgi:CRP-like cAMP-binding protein